MSSPNVAMLHVASERFQIEGENLENIVESNKILSTFGFHTRASSSLSFITQHPPYFDQIQGSPSEGQVCDHLSAYSTPGWFWLERARWYRMVVTRRASDANSTRSQTSCFMALSGGAPRKSSGYPKASSQGRGRAAFVASHGVAAGACASLATRFSEAIHSTMRAATRSIGCVAP